jgi:hypothetical protein
MWRAIPIGPLFAISDLGFLVYRKVHTKTFDLLYEAAFVCKAYECSYLGGSAAVKCESVIHGSAGWQI